MSIEPMKRVWLVGERRKLRGLLDFLAARRVVHLVDVTEEPVEAEDEAPAFSRQTTDPVEIDGRIVRLHHVLDLMNAWHPAARSFGENFVNFPLELTGDEVAEAVGSLDVDELDGRLTVLADEAAALGHRMEEIHLELRHLTTWTDISGPAPALFRWCAAFVGTVTERMARMLSESEKAREILVVSERGRGRDNRVLLQVVALKEDEAAAEELLRQFEFIPLPLPFGVSVVDMIRALRKELSGYEERTVAIRETMTGLTRKHRARVIAVLAHWETRREVLTSEERSLGSKRMTLISGYVRTRDVDDLTDALDETFPETGLTFTDPAPDENVPVELHTNRFFEPAQTLTTLFGLPHYRAFDPSPFIMFNFLLFFGFCFGDVVYGLILLGLSLWIAGRVKDYPGYRHFFVLLAWAGGAAVIVGALTGAWAANLPDYFGADNVLVRLRNVLMVADPLSIPVKALLVALGVGVVNQFYGIIMRIYRDARMGDWAGAIFDGGLWLITLPGLLMAITALFSPPVPAWVSHVGLRIFLVGAVGLFLTQGRREKSIVGKVVVGLVSIYGILGSYGATGFIGDTLSYCRLLALGLTTTIVGMSFNRIAAKLLGTDPGVLSMLLFAAAVMLGHTFNFLINILGAFVHSGRLIFMEFFGRFYESGGVRFSPLGTSKRVRVVD
ncbi:MAG TPA: V-type ATPase 116kDa subunit family protein [Planctomycetota bacterium]|nr:V-type ATPase 116kDa subunit family protein [Planctomycetota bacterium]